MPVPCCTETRSAWRAACCKRCMHMFSALRPCVRTAVHVSASLLSSGCLSQSYEVSAPELRRLVELAPEARGERMRVTQQTAFSSDTNDLSPELDAADWALLLASDVSTHHHWHDADDDADDDDIEADSAEAALAAAVVALAAATTAAVTIGVTEGARFDGWVRARPDQPLLLVDPSGERRWARLAELTPELVYGVDRAIFPDFAGDLSRLERHPLDRAGFVYQLELGAEPPPFEGAALAFAARGGLGYMPDQRYGILLGAAFASAASNDSFGSDTSLNVDYRVFLQAEAWPVSVGRLHLGPYAELGYAWVRADDPLGTRSADAWMLALGAALQLDWTTRLALTLRAGAAWLPSVDSSAPLTTHGHRLAPAVTLGFSIY